MSDIDREEIEEAADQIVEVISISIDKMLERDIPRKIAKLLRVFYLALIEEGFNPEEAIKLSESLGKSQSGLKVS